MRRCGASIRPTSADIAASVSPTALAIALSYAARPEIGRAAVFSLWPEGDDDWIKMRQQGPGKKIAHIAEYSLVILVQVPYAARTGKSKNHRRLECGS